MEDLIKYIKPFRNRLIIKGLLIGGLKGLIAGLLLSLILVSISYFIPIEFIALYIFAVITLSILIFAGYSFSKKIDYYNTAIIIDSLGAKERIATALWETESIYSQLLLDDAINTIKKLRPKGPFLITVPKRLIYTPILLTVFLIATTLFPNPFDELFAQRSAVRDEVSKQMEKVETILIELEELNEIQRETMDGLKDVLKGLVDELMDFKEPEDALESFSKAYDKLENHMENLAEKMEIDLENIINQMKQFGFVQLKDIDLSHINHNDIKELIERLEEFNKEGDGIEVLKELLDELKNSLNSLEHIERIASELRQSQTRISSAMGPGFEGNHLPPSFGIESGNNGEGFSNQQGNDSRDGLESIGTNEGYKMDIGNEGAIGGGAGLGEGNKDFDTLYIPDRKEIEYYLTQAGKAGEGDIFEFRDYSGPTGELIPYDMIIANYSKMARDSIERGEIPEGLKNLARDYFNSLER